MSAFCLPMPRFIWHTCVIIIILYNPNSTRYLSNVKCNTHPRHLIVDDDGVVIAIPVLYGISSVQKSSKSLAQTHSKIRPFSDIKNRVLIPHKTTSQNTEHTPKFADMLCITRKCLQQLQPSLVTLSFVHQQSPLTLLHVRTFATPTEVYKQQIASGKLKPDPIQVCWVVQNKMPTDSRDIEHMLGNLRRNASSPICKIYTYVCTRMAVASVRSRVRRRGSQRLAVSRSPWSKACTFTVRLAAAKPHSWISSTIVVR